MRARLVYVFVVLATALLAVANAGVGTSPGTASTASSPTGARVALPGLMASRVGKRLGLRVIPLLRRRRGGRQFLTPPACRVRSERLEFGRNDA